MTLPLDVQPYSRTLEFTEESVPAGLLKAHATKDGTWALIHVLRGRLAYRIDDPRRQSSEIVLTPDTLLGVIEPTILHAVKPLGPVCFYVEFHRREESQTRAQA